MRTMNKDELMNLIQEYIESEKKLSKMKNISEQEGINKSILYLSNWVKIDLLVASYFASNIIIFSLVFMFTKENVAFYELFFSNNLSSYAASVQFYSILFSHIFQAIFFAGLTVLLCNKADKEEGAIPSSSDYYSSSIGVTLFIATAFFLMSLHLSISLISLMFVLGFVLHHYNLLCKKRKTIQNKTFIPINKITELKDNIENIKKDIMNDEDALVYLINLEDNSCKDGKLLISLKEKIVEDKKAELKNNDILSFNLKEVKNKKTIINE